MLEKELIKLKGTIDGIKIYLDAECSISDITNSLYEKLRQFRKFFGDGHCNIYFAGRNLEASDKMRLEAVVTAMLPESTVNYGERKKVREADDIERTLKLPNDIEESKEEENADDSSFEKIKEVSTTNFKSSRARFYEGLVRSGKTVESDGHLVLVGDVEKGAKLVAVGNVVVLGSLRGSVEAGGMGNDKAYVIALDFAPTDIRIAKKLMRFDENSFNGMNKSRKAFLASDMIYTEDFIYSKDIIPNISQE